MSVTELRCPSCAAPVPASGAATQNCTFCGATLVVRVPDADVDRREEHFVTLEVVGPSNRERIVDIIIDALGLEPTAAAAIVEALPADLGAWKRADEAAELCGRLEGGGAIAKVGVRIVETPRLPARDVMLDQVGPTYIEVVKVIRKHLSLGLKDTKDLVDSAPSQLARALDGERAAALRDDLVAAGATVRLVP